MQKNKPMYIIGDGDKIREHIERYLLSGDLENVAKLSQAITNAIQQIKTIALETSNAKIIMAGGDDILLIVDPKDYQKDLIGQMHEKFLETSGCTMSFGTGYSIEEAYLNLRRSKSSRNSKNVEKKNG